MMAFDKELDLRTSLDLNFKILSIFGYWLPEGTKGFSKILYVIYSCFIIGLCFITYTVTEVINLYLSLDDLTKLSDASFLFLTHMTQLFKLYYFVVNYEKILTLVNSLNREIFKPRNIVQWKMLKTTMSYSKNLYKIYIAMCAACVLLWGVFPIIDKTEDGIELPLAAWYPFDTNNSPIFEFIYFYQIFSVLMDATTNISMDTTASGFMAHICGQLDVLNDALIHIRDQALKNIQELRIPTEKMQKALQEEMDKELIRCVVHHINILEMTEEISGLFNFTVLCQFASGCIIMCITMFELTLVKILSIQFVSMVLYQACILTELTFYCWYGNEIILKSSELLNSAYFSDWADCTTSYKKNLLMIMVRTFRPLKLYAGNLFTLSLESFMAILRTSWSYFAVLNRVHSRND